MSLAGTLRATFSPDLGIDLGTANTVVYSHVEGVLVSRGIVGFDPLDQFELPDHPVILGGQGLARGARQHR